MQTIKLAQDSLQHYFPSANITNSHHTVPGNTYDFVDHSSDVLLVSVGDSWTWGSGITGREMDIHSIDSEQDLRRQQLWGHLVARKLGADWLNLAQYAQGNRWMADRVNDLRILQPFLHYKKIIVVCVFTGAGRWFNTAQDQRVDYKEKFKSGMTETADYDRFLEELNESCVRDILMNINSTSNMQLLMGTNMVEHLGFDQLNDAQLLKTPWYRLLDETFNSNKDKVYTDMSSMQYLPKLEQFLKNSEQRYVFQKWMMQQLELAESRHIMFDNKTLYPNHHPLARGHKVWADYILEKILK
jgi:hypothetical protein